MNVFILAREEMMNLLQRNMVPRGRSGNYMVKQLSIITLSYKQQFISSLYVVIFLDFISHGWYNK